MKKGILILIFLIVSSVLISFSVAHIPEIVIEDRDYTTYPIIIEEPEISYAYYGKLQGSPQLYKIESDEAFSLYVSLLVPYIGQEETPNVEFHIWKNGEKIVKMHDYQNWTKWYEEYGGDWYLQGPIYEANVEAGIYIVEVHSDTNLEEYTLAIGKVERFGPREILWTIIILPVMKAIFWDNYMLISIYVIIAVAIILIIFWIYKKRKNKRKRK
ncbi:MAG: hypothetical protein NWF08_02910 [Candidatus Bathyarchaeota archaeon]|nr:hypothetical protein [Candidatus Bathyarchaeota archaeon]